MIFKIGDKVKIISKSTGVSFDESRIKIELLTRAKGQEYVYIVGAKNGRYRCNYQPWFTWYADYFLEKDLVLHSEDGIGSELVHECELSVNEELKQILWMIGKLETERLNMKKDSKEYLESLHKQRELESVKFDLSMCYN